MVLKGVGATGIARRDASSQCKRLEKKFIWIMSDIEKNVQNPNIGLFTIYYMASLFP